MVRHCMDINKKLTKHISPLQKQVIITVVQPVYALGKQLQWSFPDKYADVVWTMGALHIEMEFLDQWVTG